ncbi:MAG: hypothetical protein C5B55_11270 [Blastocatellia bacterium]|nr:MAG: hypothetical protein C5B55_11270 [Blastocatellia bacterium]
MSKFSARIHVLLASDARIGVVIRRGPSKQVCTVLWDRKHDRFTLGQWLKGRIYERRCDISPDGEYFIYFAMNGKWSSEVRGSWTAISKVPYLKALAIFPKGDCWNGGGLFTSKTSYWLNDGYGHSVLRDTTLVTPDLEFQPIGGHGGECLGVYYPRLLREGWTLVERVNVVRWKDLDLFDKPLRYGWTLRKIAHAEVGAPPGKGCYWDEHELRHASGESHKYVGWEWADIDRNRLVWAKDGKLFAGRINRHGLNNEVQLFDFNDMTFERLEAPY